MAKAQPGEIYVSEPVRRAAGDAFDWEDLAPIMVKGKAEPIAVCALTGSRRRASRRQSANEIPLVGRWAELETMSARLDEALAGQGRVVGVSAEAGMGKSRLVAEFARLPRAARHRRRARRVPVVRHEHELLRLAGHLVDAAAASTRRLPEDERTWWLEAELAAIDPALVPRAPLLAGLLDLPIPDNELTAQFDAKLRKTSLEGPARRVPAGARERRAGAARARGLPLARPAVARPARGARAARRRACRCCSCSPTGRPPTSAAASASRSLPHFGEIALAELDDTHAALLIRSKLAQMLGADAEPPAALVELVTARAQGNPFYIEELLNFIRGQGVDLRDEAALKRLELPESLHSLILSRIDTLAEAPRRTLKVASVIGRVFRAPLLPGVYPELGALDAVRQHLRDARRRVDLVNVDQEADETYLFKHVVTQEVAYESMPFAFRSMLHERVGGYIERTEADAIERNLDLLAHHYWHSENLPKKREYLRRAGDAAQAAYANAAAIDYFERLLPLVEQGERVDVLLKLGKVLELVGDWPRAEQVDGEALALAESLGDAAARGRARRRWPRSRASRDATTKPSRGSTARRAGSASWATRAASARVLHLAGTVAAQRGDYAKAVENYEASLAIRERAGDKASMAQPAVESRHHRRVSRRLRAARAASTSARSRCAPRSATAAASATRRTASA